MFEETTGSVWMAFAAFVSALVATFLGGCVDAQAGVTTCSSLHGPHCFALNERNVPSYLLQDVEFEPTASAGGRRAIPHIDVHGPKIASHGHADDLLFGDISIRDVTSSDEAQDVLDAMYDFMRSQPNLSDEMFRTAMEVAATKLNALLGKTKTGDERTHEPVVVIKLRHDDDESRSLERENDIEENPTEPHAETPTSTAASPAVKDVASIKESTLVTMTRSLAGDELFADEEIVAFMLLSRSEKNVLLEFDVERTRELIKAQGRYVRRQKQRALSKGGATPTAGGSQAGASQEMVEVMTLAFKQRVADFRAVKEGEGRDVTTTTAAADASNLPRPPDNQHTTSSSDHRPL
ncbi:Aste57867_15353 [Aphanomyces stellatus]|uniref:Aste57867_15353 protein n=1 Tax=Aphanomyces stellatus TaxID=120398 RepID=A0A485L3X1_9STRA|nr:hypothetical protein As57867_015297 [Aphanomyces stellatus]VFT92161.1 Aste57867_15353 [Aphanomyces stellatus]